MTLQALLVLALLIVTVVALPAAFPVAAQATTEGVALQLSPAGTGELMPGQDLTLTLTLDNDAQTTIPEGTIDVSLAGSRFETTEALDAWLHPAADDDGSGADDAGDSGESTSTTAPETPADTGRQIASLATEPLGPTESRTRTIVVPAAQVGLAPTDSWGARGLAATWRSGDGEVAQGRSSLVWYSGEQVTPARIAVALPMITPAGSTGLISEQTLEAYTGPGGILTRELDGVADTAVAIGIDPMIIASIRALGSDAPDSAVQWLERLRNASNEIFPLAYGDADIAVQAQSGLPALLAPTSFAFALDAARFQNPPSDLLPTETSKPVTSNSTGAGSGGSNPADAVEPTTSGEPSPEPTTGAPAVPTLEELLDWDYTTTGIGWPGDGTVTAADLPVFAASGVTTTILSSGNVQNDTAGQTPITATTVGDSEAIVSDDGISLALRDAMASSGDAEWRSAMSEVSSRLAIVASADAAQPRTVFATFDRQWSPSSFRISETVAALDTPWSDPAGLEGVIASTPTTGTSLLDRPESDTRIAALRALVERGGQLEQFATVLADSALLTGRERLEVLAILAVSWIDDEQGWSDVVAAHQVASYTTTHSVTIAPATDITMASPDSYIPVTVVNDLDLPATVQIRATPSNGRLQVESGTSVTVEANSRASARLPVEARVGNGQVSLQLQLVSPVGVEIDQPSTLNVSVHADWEGIGATILAVLVIAFFGFGVLRTISRRRKARADAASEDAAAEEASAAPASPANPDSADPDSTSSERPHDG